MFERKNHITDAWQSKILSVSFALPKKGQLIRDEFVLDIFHALLRFFEILRCIKIEDWKIIEVTGPWKFYLQYEFILQQ